MNTSKFQFPCELQKKFDDTFDSISTLEHSNGFKASVYACCIECIALIVLLAWPNTMAMLVITVLSLVGFTLQYVIYREVMGQTLRIITSQIDDSDDVLLDISTQSYALVH